MAASPASTLRRLEQSERPVSLVSVASVAHGMVRAALLCRTKILTTGSDNSKRSHVECHSLGSEAVLAAPGDRCLAVDCTRVVIAERAPFPRGVLWSLSLLDHTPATSAPMFDNGSPLLGKLRRRAGRAKYLGLPWSLSVRLDRGATRSSLHRCNPIKCASRPTRAPSGAAPRQLPRADLAWPSPLFKLSFGAVICPLRASIPTSG